MRKDAPVVWQIVDTEERRSQMSDACRGWQCSSPICVWRFRPDIQYFASKLQGSLRTGRDAQMLGKIGKNAHSLDAHIAQAQNSR